MNELQRQYLQQQLLFGKDLYLNEGDLLPPSTPESGAPPADPQQAQTLEELNNMVAACSRCPLAATRKHTVFGYGNPRARLLLVGEAPGADEDATGLPFVGRSGKLLDRILAAVDLSREEVFIANVIKCRPPRNRDPNLEEVAACEPFLWRQIDLIQPRLILALGRVAANTLLENKSSLGSMRNRIHDYHGVPLVVTYHPSALLRFPQYKKPTWDDIRWVRKLYDEAAADE